MDWAELFRAASGNTVVQFVLGFLFLVFGSNAILSEKTAKEKFWLLGRLSEWVQSRRVAQAEYEESVERRRTEDLRNEIKRVDEARKSDNRELRARIQHLEESERDQHRYIVWVTEKMRVIEVWAADKGLELPPPPFLTFSEWKDGKGSE